MDSNESDEDETFVTIGTPLEIPDEDDPRKKPIQLQSMGAQDAKGRPRFHGAFTGGFSAGYFNTVGSKKGFTPSTFVSSRSQKADAGEQQRPEDYMDDDDFGEHGIAPRKLVTGGQFSSEERKRRRHEEAKAVTEDSAITVAPDLVDIVIPERICVGVKLLRKMGWKEGQGLGPRVSRKQRKHKAGKVYGCELPPSSSDEDDLDDDSFLKDITYAPRDVAHILLSAKTNTHGLGYRGLDPRAALPSTHVNLFGPPTITKTGRKGIRGQAFGVGALEDEDDDIYSTDHMSNYDMTMGTETDDNFGWTAPKSRGEQQTPVGYIGKVLGGFSLSSTPLVQKKDFSPPSLPRHYRPVHVVRRAADAETTSSTVNTGFDSSRTFLRPGEQTTDEAQSTTGSRNRDTGKMKYGDAMSRSLALGEKPFVGSVFDLIPKADKEKMTLFKTPDVPVSDNTHTPVDVPASVQHDETSRPTPSQSQHSNNLDLAPPSSIAPPSCGITPPPIATKTPPAAAGVASIDDMRQQNVPLLQSGAGFKPFAKDPAKQERYEKYLELEQQGHRDPYASMASTGQTEWERGREGEEFVRAARLYRPLAGMMAMRFTSGRQQHDEAMVDVKVDESVDKSDAQKAAEMKMYGKLTRDVVEWHPDRLVCKRFNIPDPYPGSSIVGLATVKRDKFSVFNFLEIANTPTSRDDLLSMPPPSIIPAETSGSVTKETEPGSRADKELNKSKSMKSIFSHLIDTDKNSKPTQKADAKPVSFTVKSVKQGQPKEYKSIFSHLEDKDGIGKSKVVAMETNQSVTEQDEPAHSQTKLPDSNKPASTASQEASEKTIIKPSNIKPEKPPTDLFRAIFRNTDSEESSSSEDEDNGEDVDTTPSVSHVGPPILATVIKTEPAPIDNDHSTETTGIHPHGTNSRLPGNNEEIPSLEQRLSPDHVSSGSDGEYGPALPPPIPMVPAGVQPTGRSVVDGVSRDSRKESSRKQKHKHKEKHKHKSKKDKKDKSKKHRHKSKNRKEKKRHRRVSSSSSDGTTDKDTDSDGEPAPNDRDLLQKFKVIKPGQRMSAADFM